MDRAEVLKTIKEIKRLQAPRCGATDDPPNLDSLVLLLADCAELGLERIQELEQWLVEARRLIVASPSFDAWPVGDSGVWTADAQRFLESTKSYGF